MATGAHVPIQCAGAKADETSSLGLRVAFIGNSFTFYNDLPHIVQQMLAENGVGASLGPRVHIGACLRGGASFTSLWSDGADMLKQQLIGGRDMYSSVGELLSIDLGWHVVVLQDHSQWPARATTRERSVTTLKDHYIPLLLSMKFRPSIVLYQTWAYRKSTNGSEEIGDFMEMTSRLAVGYDVYSSLLNEAGLTVVTAKVGSAFTRAHAHAKHLWNFLYKDDDYHPTGLASFLSAAHIATAIADAIEFSRPAGFRVSPRWPRGIIPLRAGNIPSDNDLAMILSVAGPQDIKPTAPRRLLVLGSSVCTGAGAENPSTQGWAAHLASSLRAYGFDYDNKGVGGTTVDYWQKVVDSPSLQLATFGIVVMSLSLGNEGLADQGNVEAIKQIEKHYVSGLLSIVRGLREGMLPGARLVVGGLYFNDSYSREHLDVLYRVLATIRSWEEVDLVLDFLQPTCHDGNGHWHEGSSSDPGHPNSFGHMQMYKCVEPAAILGTFLNYPVSSTDVSCEYMAVDAR